MYLYDLYRELNKVKGKVDNDKDIKFAIVSVGGEDTVNVDDAKFDAGTLAFSMNVDVGKEYLTGFLSVYWARFDNASFDIVSIADVHSDLFRPLADVSDLVSVVEYLLEKFVYRLILSVQDDRGIPNEFAKDIVHHVVDLLLAYLKGP